MDMPTRHFYCFSLATFKKVEGHFILNAVRDFQPAEVPYNSIGVLQIGSSQSTAWVIAAPKQLLIAETEVLCIVCACGHSIIDPFLISSSDLSIRFTFAQTEADIYSGLSS